MKSLLWLINSSLGKVFDLLWTPFAGVDPVWPLVFVSLPSGALMLWIFGKLSDQLAIRRLKNYIWGSLLAVWIYQHDIAVTFRLQAQVFKTTLSYLRLILLPLLAMVVPVILILSQMGLRLENRPAEPGEPLLLKLQVSQMQDFRLEVPAEIEVETPPLRIASKGEVVWRIRPRQPGDYVLRVSSDDSVVEKRLKVGGAGAAVSGARVAAILPMLLHPGEPPIGGDTVVNRIEIGYSSQEITLAGLNLHWILLFFIFSMISAFAFKGILGVEF